MRPINQSHAEFLPSSALEKSGREKVLILVKALPHVGQRHGETVCCAGVTLDGQWRRQYPIHFRRLKDQFRRWQWIEYDWIAPGSDDRRGESRRVQEETIEVGDLMPERERAVFLDRIMTGSTKEAAAKGMSLTLVRPTKVRFRWKAKTEKQVAEERLAYEDSARQKSFLDPDLVALSPAPTLFISTGLTRKERRTRLHATIGKPRRPSIGVRKQWASRTRWPAWSRPLVRITPPAAWPLPWGRTRAAPSNGCWLAYCG